VPKFPKELSCHLRLQRILRLPKVLTLVQMAASRQLKNIVNEFIAGGISSCLSKIISAPFERVKLLQQFKVVDKQSNCIESFYQIITKQSFFALWRGCTADIVRCFPAQALNIVFKNAVGKLVSKTNNQSNYTKWLINVLNGTIAGSLSLAFVYPLDLARTKMAVDFPGTTYNGLIDCLSTSVRKDGFLALYSGFGLSCIGILVYRASYFMLYDSLKPYLRNVSSFLFGYGMTVVAGLISYPLDTIRRFQILHPQLSVVDATKEVWSDGGITAFFNGSFTNLIRGIVGALVLFGCDYVQQQLQSKRRK